MPTVRKFRGFVLFFLFSAVSVLSLSGKNIKIAGKEYIGLESVGSKLGMKYVPHPNNKCTLSSKWTRLDFQIHKRDFFLDGIKVHLGHSIGYSERKLYISTNDYDNTLAPILTPQIFKKVPKLYTIVIDPGHGGKDTGAMNRTKKLYEKELTLDVVKRLKKKLGSLGYRVILTRSSDSFVPLKTRADVANRNKADLFISMHFNAAGASSVRGLETFTYTPRYQPSTGRSNLTPLDKTTQPGNKQNTWSTLIGYYIHRELIRNLKANDRGLKRARFTVLQYINCPGILIEGGFISNTSDANLAKSPAYRQKFADTIAEGVLRYQRTINRLRGR